jgi:hypothetical protein
MSSFGYYFMVVSALGISLLAEELLGGKMLGVLPVMLRVKVLIIYFFTAMLLGGYGQGLLGGLAFKVVFSLIWIRS